MKPEFLRANKLARKTHGSVSVMVLLTDYLLLPLLVSVLWIESCDRYDASVARYELEPVVVVGSQWYGHVPIWVGIERGIFAGHGFEVVWRFEYDSSDRIEKISIDDAQFASVGEIAMLIAMSKDERGFYWVGSQDNALGLEGLVARKGIEDFAGLQAEPAGRRKKIGLPFDSSVEMTCRLLLRDNGLDPDDDVDLVDLAAGNIATAFRAGKVDAALIWEPGFSRLRRVKGATLLGRDGDTKAYREFSETSGEERAEPEPPRIGTDVLIISKAWVDENSSRARRFLQAYFEALDWVEKNPDRTAAIAHRMYMDQELATIREILASAEFEWYGPQDQKSVVLGKKGLLEQAELVLDLLIQEKKIEEEEIPDVGQWLKLDLIPPTPPDS